MSRAPWAALTAVLVGAACPAGSGPTVQPTSAPAPPGDTGASGAEEAPMATPPPPASAAIQAAVAQSRSVTADSVHVDFTGTLPGGHVFRFHVGDAPRRGAFGAGVVLGDEVALGKVDAVRRAMVALGGAAADPSEVARVVGVLLGSPEPTYPVVTARDRDVLRADWREVVTLPARTDGGFLFWVRSGEPPALRVEVAFADGAASASTRPIWTLLKRRD